MLASGFKARPASRVALLLIKDVAVRLDHLRVVRKRAGRLRALLLELKKVLSERLDDKEDAERIARKEEFAVRAEPPLRRLQTAVSRLEVRPKDDFGLVRAVLLARREEDTFDEDESTLRALAKEYGLWSGALLERGDSAKLRDANEDVLAVKAVLQQAKREAEASWASGSQKDLQGAAEALEKALEGKDGPEIDDLLRSDSTVLKKVLEFSKVVSLEEQRKEANIMPDELQIDDDDELGRGEFGPIVAGCWNSVDVAVKRCVLARGPKLVEIQNEIIREIKKWREYNHRNIVKLFGVSMRGPGLVIVMEKFNLSLHDLLHDTDANLTDVDQETIMKSIARGLAYLHQQNEIHRDLKPSNVLLGLDLKSNVKLSDFGDASVKEAASKLKSDLVQGSWCYKAPELFQKPPEWSSRSDMYAFAVVCWEIVERQIPWRGMSIPSILDAVRSGERPAFGLDTPWKKRFEQLVSDCWAAEPGKRPEAIEALGLLEGHVRERRSTRVLRHLLKFLHPSSSKSLHLPVTESALPSENDIVRGPDVEPRVLQGHSGVVRGVLLSKNGIIVSCSNDMMIRVWDVRNGRLLRKLEGHKGSVMSVAMSNNILVSSGLENIVRIWSLENGDNTHLLEGHTNSVRSVAIHGGIIATGSHDKTVKLWHARTATLIRTLTGHGDYVRGVAFADEGNLVVSCSDDKTVRVWRSSDGTLVRNLEGHSSWVYAIAVQGDVVASAGGNNELKLWSISRGDLLHSFVGHSAEIHTVSMEGDWILSGSHDQTIQIWRISTKERMKTLDEEQGKVFSVCLTNGIVVSGSTDTTVRIWGSLQDLVIM